MSAVSDIHPGVSVPERYRSLWQQSFHDAIRPLLHDGMTILDVGSGRNPALLPAARPPHTAYIGLDLSAEELRLAGAMAYDEIVVTDLVSPVDGLIGTVDLAVSWQVFEHVKPLDRALQNLYAYLKPGGTLIGVFSGKWSVFGILNQMLPHALGQRLVEQTMRRRGGDQPVFPAYYDRCSDRGLHELTAGWTHAAIHPLFRGANYFHFSRGTRMRSIARA